MELCLCMYLYVPCIPGWMERERGRKIKGFKLWYTNVYKRELMLFTYTHGTGGSIQQPSPVRRVEKVYLKMSPTFLIFCCLSLFSFDFLVLQWCFLFCLFVLMSLASNFFSPLSGILFLNAMKKRKKSIHSLSMSCSCSESHAPFNDPWHTVVTRWTLARGGQDEEQQQITNIIIMV